jgi:GNAT superfamily N-acetyltransferase
MNVEIVPFDPKTASRAEWARFHTYRRLRHQETDAGDPDWDDATVETWLIRGQPHWERASYAVLEPGGSDVQIGEVSCQASLPGSPPHEMNKHMIMVGAELLRPFRRRGIGRAMLAHGAGLAEARGRSVVESWAEEEDGKAVAAAIGAKVVQHRFENRLALERVDWAMVERWVAEGPARSPSSTFHWFRDAVPEEIIEEYTRAFTEVFNRQPMGEGSFKGIVVTPEVFRDRAALNADVHGTWLGAYTREPDGEISGLTETFYVPDQPTFLGQGLTGVRSRHLRRGLGKWLKAAMLLRVREEFPEVRIVRTGNATENAAMLSINNRLGFRPHKNPVVVEMTVEALRAHLGDPAAGKP